jgi:hypothetical protein
LNRFQPSLAVLGLPQRRVWEELGGRVAPQFVMYGGTALALRLAHRASVDFDFFSSRPFEPGELLRALPWASEAEVRQSSPNTLTISVERGAPVAVSFFGNLTFGRVGDPEQANDNRVLVASLGDLAATKMKVVQDRAESKDYEDVAALLKAGRRLPRMLGEARAVYGELFNPQITLKALAYFDDGDLWRLSSQTKSLLAEAVAAVNDIPKIERVSNQLAP